jgi:hypothetical protein
MWLHRNRLTPLDRHPLVIFLLALCVLSGVVNLATNPPTAPHVPGWVNASWYILLILGGVAALVGAYLRDAITGVLVVRAGLLPLGAGAYAYALAVGYHGTAVDLLGAAVVAIFGLAAHWRAAQITLHVRAVRRAAQAGLQAEPQAGTQVDGGRL